MKKSVWLMLAVMVLPFVVVNEAAAQLNGGGYHYGQNQAIIQADKGIDGAAARAAVANLEPVSFYAQWGAVTVQPELAPHFCLGISEAAEENVQGKAGLLLEQCSQIVGKYAAMAKQVKQKKAETAQNAGKEYYNVWMTYDAADGWSTLGRWCVDGICYLGKQAARNYLAGYEAMGRSYMNYSPVEGFSQLGEVCVDGVCWIGKRMAHDYIAGYQAMGEGYAKMSPAEGWADLWCWFKKGVKKVLTSTAPTSAAEMPFK